MNDYYRLILTDDNQATYGSPVYTNLNFPNLEPYSFCKVFIESAGLVVNEDVGGSEAAHDFVSIEIKNFHSSNTQECNGSFTKNSSIIDILHGIKETHTGEGHGVIQCCKNKVSDIFNDGAVFPINVLQNNSIALDIKYADGTIVAAPPAPHNQYKIILGIQLIKS